MLRDTTLRIRRNFDNMEFRNSNCLSYAVMMIKPRAMNWMGDITKM
jgi:hypothetical protein